MDRRDPASHIARSATVMSDEAMSERLLKVGIIGSVIAAICCFTPVLVIGLGAAGLAALVGYLDAVLLPALLVFLVITGYALWRCKRAA